MPSDAMQDAMQDEPQQDESMDESMDLIAAERERVARLVESAMRTLATAIRNGDAGPPKRTKTTKAPKPKADDGPTADELDVVRAVLTQYPARPEPVPYVPVRNAVIALLRDGHDGATLVKAALRYHSTVQRAQTEPGFVIGAVRFFAQGVWEAYRDVVTVYGRTRDEWRRSGQDVAEFDRMAAEIAAKEAMSA